MFKGILFILSACLIWGLIFVIPTLIEGFSPLEVALGRYFFYGILSLVLFLIFSYRNLLNYPFKIWFQAFLFAFVVNIAYYTTLVFAIQYSNAALTTLIAGISPVSIALYGNWKNKEESFSKLIFPALLMILGLLIVNLDAFFDAQAFQFSFLFILGVMGAFIALGAWTWFVEANSRFLRKHPSITNYDWSTLMGLATLTWVIIIASLWVIFTQDTAQFQKYFSLSYALKGYLIGTAVLGLLCSWVGSYLWNSGCNLLPLSLSGQLTIFETIFGLFFVYLIEQRLPTYWEGSGITLMLLAIIYSLNSLAKAPSQPLHT